MSREINKQMINCLFSPEIQGCISAAESIAGYKLSTSDRQPFLYFHDYLTEPEPDFITVWRKDPEKEWYHEFTNGILDNVQNTLACILYHHERLIAIEDSVMKGIEKYNYRKALGNFTVGLGNTLIWDFEYQAFVLACRRCLDYLTKAICAYFKSDFHSFRKLGGFLKKQNHPIVTKPLISLHAKYKPKFDSFLSNGGQSVRDKISHSKYVPAGCINLSKRGCVLVGGGEELGVPDNHSDVLLSEVLQKHVTNIRSCIKEFIITYVDSIKTEQQERLKK